MRSAFFSDLTLESLLPLEKWLESGDLKPKDVLIVIPVQWTTSIYELLFFDKMEWLKSHASKEYLIALKTLRMNFMKKQMYLQVEMVHTDSPTSIDLFLKAVQCIEMIIPSLSIYNWKHPKILNLHQFLYNHSQGIDAQMKNHLRTPQEMRCMTKKLKMED